MNYLDENESYRTTVIWYVGHHIRKRYVCGVVFFVLIVVAV